MFRIILHSLAIFTLTVSMLSPITMDVEPAMKPEPTMIVGEPLDSFTKDISEKVSNVAKVEKFEAMVKKAEQVKAEKEKAEASKKPKMSREDIELIALLTMAEAEGEPEYGKRLVIDTVLNRIDSDWNYWPDTVKGVVYQKGQFSAMWNGRVDRCYVMDDIVKLVEEELEHRTNNEVVYFRLGRYSKYGTPMFKEGNHYFSKRE